MSAQADSWWQHWWISSIAAVALLTFSAAKLSMATQSNATGCVPVAEGLLPVVARAFELADAVFPRKVEGEKPSEFVLTLRYLAQPAIRDSQIVVSKRLQGGYTVTRYSLPVGSKSLGEQADDFVKRGAGAERR